jgi:hypothetical protein
VSKATDRSLTDWQPATSEPGELFTVQGEIRAAGAFARGLRNRDARLAPYRRSMVRVAAVVLGIGGMLALLAAVLL